VRAAAGEQWRGEAGNTIELKGMGLFGLGLTKGLTKGIMLASEARVLKV